MTTRLAALASSAPLCALLVLACSNGRSAATPPANSGAASPAPTTTTPPANPDPDQAANGTGVPAGYVGKTDDPSRPIADAKYTPGPNGTWTVQTGPAHILYSTKDTASGAYTLHAEIDQLEAPHHPEAYGVFFGGQNLTDPTVRYTYFLVRGDGKYALKARDGANARTVVDFTPSPNVPTADASGKATYTIAVQVGADSVHFMVNGKPVAAVPTGTLSVAGIAGVRINHNLHVTIKPLAVSR
jgi:hypothetical protein